MTKSKLTQKQEKFCQAVVLLGNHTAAYRESYNVKPDTKEATINNDAYKLMKKPEIVARIDELKGKVVEKMLVTAETIAKELEEARVLALTADDNGRVQSGAAVSASMGKAKLFGLLVDKKEIKGSMSLIETLAELDE